MADRSNCYFRSDNKTENNIAVSYWLRSRIIEMGRNYAVESYKKDIDKNPCRIEARGSFRNVLERRRGTVLPDKVLSGGGGITRLNFIGVRAIKRDRKT